MPSPVRFLFSGNDVQKILVDTIQINDALPGTPLQDLAFGSMQLGFRQSDPGPVQIRALLPGTILFLPDSASPGIVPDPLVDSFTEADFPNWRTTGRILVTAADRSVKDLAALAPELLVIPNRIWYGPVQIPSAFLFDTLTSKLKKGIIRTAAGATIMPTNSAWGKHAIAAFLGGRHAPTMETANDPSKDDRIRCVMPTVVVPPGGDIKLTISCALAQKPQDAPDSQFEDPPPPVVREEPLHPRNGLVPAREVYRRLRQSMVADPADVRLGRLMDAVLIDWPAAPRFIPIAFTRTWSAVPNCSAFFPRQSVQLRSAGAVLQDQSLPAHGIVYLCQMAPPAGQPTPPAPIVQVSLTGTMKWIAGGSDSWRRPAGDAAIELDLEATPKPHFSVRLPMSEAIFSDRTRPSPGGMSCTFLSLRRTVARALVDNRIAGGRLNFGVNYSSPATRDIIQTAFAQTPAHVIPRPTVGLVADNRPDPLGNPNLALTLEPILRAFFSDSAVQWPGPGTSATVYDNGQMVYRLWQSIIKSFQDNATRRNFSDDHIGRGAPGSMVAVGLAAFHLDPTQNAGEADNAYFDRIVDLMLAGLPPGALLQFWNRSSDFVDIKNRVVILKPDGTPDDDYFGYGHSPLFVGYVQDAAGNAVGLRILDQFGESRAMVVGAAGSRRIEWHSARQEVWIAANWTE